MLPTTISVEAREPEFVFTNNACIKYGKLPDTWSGVVEPRTLPERRAFPIMTFPISVVVAVGMPIVVDASEIRPPVNLSMPVLHVLLSVRSVVDADPAATDEVAIQLTTPFEMARTWPFDPPFA